jgi:hypothetical protein
VVHHLVVAAVADPGVNMRMMDKIFRLCDARSDTHTYNVFISMVEIYNDEVCWVLSGDRPSSVAHAIPLVVRFVHVHRVATFVLNTCVVLPPPPPPLALAPSVARLAGG